MNSPMLISRVAAGVLLDRLRFLSTAQAMLETFQAAEEPLFSADAWALAAAELAQRLEAGLAVEMDRVNTVILVEALEGSRIGAARKGWQELAALLASRFEPYMGRRVMLDIARAADR
ncbi:hypothetical protein [Pseudomonas sp. TWP3-2]|uniref:hypothetical protein n=1 Tax=Pseudomonas sp. TWP3-2 TaxID=2804574 RepID=UPI003CF85EDF